MPIVFGLGYLLSSCMTATISPSIQSIVLDLNHAYEVWNVLAKRFSSLSRSHKHKLKCKLYTISKTSSMDNYLDQIREISHKLAVSRGIGRRGIDVSCPKRSTGRI